MSELVSKVIDSPFILLGTWIAGSVLSVIVPISKWKGRRNRYYSYIGRYVEYEQNQRAYEEAQNGENRRYGWDCKWYQFQCRKNRYYYMQNQEGGGGDRQRVQLPDWYHLLGGQIQEERREREEMGGNESTGALKFIYTWTTILFVLVGIYGAVVIYKKLHPDALIVMMAILMQFFLMQMILLPQGVITTEDREMEESIYGWYGQLSVLMVYSDFAYSLFCGIFLIIFGVRSILIRRLARKSTAQGETVASIPASEIDDGYKPAEQMNIA